MKKILLVGLSLLMACPTFAKIKLPALVGSNMVLQREREVNLWGEASPSKKVTVTTSWDGRKYTTQSDSDGKWLLKVSTPAAGGPYTIRISDGDPVTLENVMIGEVWVCSGQSNMQMSMTGNLGEPVDGGVEALIEAPKYKDIRLFYTPMVTSPQPVDTCGGEWKVSSSESVAPFSAAAYFFARDLNDALGVPVGLIQTAWGGTRIEAWMPEATAREVEADIVQTNDRFENPNKVGYLYNAMIRPLLNMTARGFIWYQGESNVHTNNYPHYAHYMEKLVSQWRGDWGDPDMPFYFVQVPELQDRSTFPELRWAQLQSWLHTPNTGMAMAMGYGEPDQIHPIQKQPVGHRLALIALAKNYGYDLTYSGPIYKGVSFEDGKAVLTFDFVCGGLASADGKPLRSFTICGEDQQFVPAEARIEGDKVVVWSDRVTAPVAVRYSWSVVPDGNLINTDSLPASPFRTDDFRLKTEGKLHDTYRYVYANGQKIIR